MPTKHKPRKGSLQFWPRKKAKKILPSANWKAIAKADKEKKQGLLGFVGYKVGMTTALVEDLTPNSMTLNEKKVLPCTIIECPAIKVFSIRFYKKGKITSEILVSKDKELKRKVKLPKKKIKEINLGALKEVDDVRLLCYTQPKLAKIKKKPDMCEIGIQAESVEKKLEIANGLIGKELSVLDVFQPLESIDVRAVTKGKGFSGPVKRFGIGLKSHKSEKGQRRPGSLGAWTPKKVSFRAPMAGQLGFFTRVQYNNQIILAGDKQEADALGEFSHYGIIRNPFLVVKGSLQGAKKRPLLLTRPLRKSKKIGNYKFLRIVK
ncbi:50S ribosomal protein L3 [Candidatus Pacearchaeota archaeon ex4484_26]|nr:MAG: 50S ribosomal protein L3 [Candidatus Pacearchaeota archaeon ex4484_26]